MTVVRRPRRTLAQIFTVPAIIGAISVAGLLSALVGDGVWDGLSWLLLAVPILLYVAFVARGRRRQA